MILTLRCLTILGLALILAGCETGPRLAGSGGSSSSTTIAAGGVIGEF